MNRLNPQVVQLDRFDGLPHQVDIIFACQRTVMPLGPRRSLDPRLIEQRLHFDCG